MSDEEFRARVERISERNRAALDRLAYGPYPLEQQCQHLLLCLPLEAMEIEIMYGCTVCDGVYEQPWETFFAGWSWEDIHRYVEGITGGRVIEFRDPA